MPEQEITNEQKKNFFLNEFKDILLSDPFSDEGRRLSASHKSAINENNFFDKFDDNGVTKYKYYVELYDKVDDISGYDESVVHEPIIDNGNQMNIFEGRSNLKKFKSELIKFEGDIEKTTTPVLTITGNKGAGKTTYLHYLAHRYGSDDLTFHIIDITKKKSVIRFLNSRIAFPDEIWDDSIWRITIQFVEFISKLICEEKRAVLLCSFNNWHSRLRIPFYQYIYQNINDEFVNNFFELLEWSVNNETDEELGKQKLKPFFEKFLKDASISKRKKARENALFVMLQIINCLFICLSSSGKRYVCAIDNIEYLLNVSNNAIVNEQDLGLLMDLIFKSLAKVDPIMDENNFPMNAYTFLLVVRTPAFSYVNRNAQSRMHDSENVIHLTLKNSVRFEEVIQKRLRMDDEFREMCRNNEYVKALDFIIKDKADNSRCMYSVITSLCNYNYLQSIAGLIDAISSQNIDELKNFCLGWAYATDEADMEYLNKKQNMKNLFRKGFLKVFFKGKLDTEEFEAVIQEIIPKFERSVTILDRNGNEISNEKIFQSHIRVTEFSTYARKILNLVRNYPLVYGGRFITLSELFILIVVNCLNKDYRMDRRWREKYVLSPELNAFVNVIYSLGNATFDNNSKSFIGRLINIDMDSIFFTEDAIKNVLISEIDKNNRCIENISKISIMPAGETFLEEMPDFEFISALYLSDNHAMYSNDGFRELTVNKSQANRYVLEKIAYFIYLHSIEIICSVLKSDFLSYEYKKNFNVVGVYGDTIFEHGNERIGCNYVKFTDDAFESCCNYALLIIRRCVGYLRNFIQHLVYDGYPEGKDSCNNDTTLTVLRKIIREYHDFMLDLYSKKYSIYIINKDNGEESYEFLNSRNVELIQDTENSSGHRKKNYKIKVRESRGKIDKYIEFNVIESYIFDVRKYFPDINFNRMFEGMYTQQ